MSDTHQTEGTQDQESPEEEMGEEERAFLFISKYAEARRALPWEQWTFREKVSYYLDRIFLGFIAIFLLVMLGEFGYKMWYVTNVKKIVEFVSDFAVLMFSWLFTQDRQEELAEL